MAAGPELSLSERLSKRRAVFRQSIGPYTTILKRERPVSDTPCSGEAAASSDPADAAVHGINKRVRFSRAGVKRIVLDPNGVGRICGEPACRGCSRCETSEDMRPSDIGRYYPEASINREKARWRELPKRPECERDPTAVWWNAFEAMCRCKTCGAKCPCAKNGIGCWWETNVAADGTSLDWGCACKGQCASSLTVYRCDLPAVQSSRQERLRELQEPAADCATPAGQQSSEACRSGAATTGRLGHARDEAMTLEELADEWRARTI